MHGRLNTLNHLREARDNPAKLPHRRMEADRAIKKIMAQLRDRKLMHLRDRLINASIAGDKYWMWKLENQMLAYNRNFGEIDEHYYTKRDEDE